MDQKNIGKPFIEIGSQHAQQQYTIYTLPRVFRDDAKLHPFLAEKQQDIRNQQKLPQMETKNVLVLFNFGNF